VKAGMPRGTGTPALRKISLPWYSWIFMISLFATEQTLPVFCLQSAGEPGPGRGTAELYHGALHQTCPVLTRMAGAFLPHGAARSLYFQHLCAHEKNLH
ncbi:MAG: hypothetical protein WCK81_14730, partial [Betaproteobacteria bacterium]